MPASPLAAGQAIALALVTGTLAQLVARRFRFPVILPLLAGGVVLGRHGLGRVDPAVFGDGLTALLSLMVALVVFEGTFHLDLAALRRVLGPLALLLTVGTALTAGLAALGAHGLLGMAWLPAWIYGAIVTVTGPTVIAPIIRRLALPGRVKVLLEAESVLIDATGVLLASVLFATTMPGGPAGVPETACRFGLGLLLGSGIGAAGAWILAKLLRTWPVEGAQVARAGSLALALGTAMASDALVRGSAISAAAVAGLVYQTLLAPTVRDEIRSFFLDLVQVALAVVFVLVAAGCDLSRLTGLGWRGFGVVCLLMGGIRPLVIWVCTLGTGWSRAERAFVAWMGPRGIVAAATGLSIGQGLVARNVPTGELLAPLVLLTIVTTVLVQAGLSGAIAHALGLSAEEPTEGRARDSQPGDGSDRQPVAS